MRVFVILVVSLLLFNPSYAKWGKGQLKLSQNVMESVLMYMYGAGNKQYSGNAKRKNDPDMMAISVDGNYSMYYYCPAEYRSHGCLQEGLQRLTILGCEKESNGTPCFLFAKKRKIVWKNGGPKLTIKRKDLKSPYVVAKKIQEAGFYDGELSELVGIDIETGQANEDNKITGDKKDKKNNIKKSTNIVEELEELAKLYENGSISKKEFDKAKSKLLNE
jgi:hypothetical protein